MNSTVTEIPKSRITGILDPDRALVESSRSGDVSAFEELVRRYDRKLHRIAQGIMHNNEDAEEVVQTAFLGNASFNIQQLVINGSQFSGTRGPITQVTGTLVCNPGADGESTHDTAAANLDAHGNAQFSGNLETFGTCANPLFLVRIFNPSGARGLWIATGVDRTLGD